MKKPNKSTPLGRETTTISSDPTLNKKAVNEGVDGYEKSTQSDQPTELAAATQKELGEVERALEDSVLAIEDAS